MKFTLQEGAVKQQEIAAGIRRKPLISARELRGMFGLTPSKFASIMSHNRDHPMPVLNHMGATTRNTWYERTAIAWFKRVLEEK